ncbi:MAG: tyrosine-type recombinase/integrase, partial [Acidimicrobiia bacterium]
PDLHGQRRDQQQTKASSSTLQVVVPHSVDGDPDGFAFTTDAGTPRRSANFRRSVWLPAVAQIDEEGLRPHDLRHTCASLLIAADAHPRHVKEHLGHSSLRVTMDVYGHLYKDARDEIAERLERQQSAGRLT